MSSDPLKHNGVCLHIQTLDDKLDFFRVSEVLYPLPEHASRSLHSDDGGSHLQ
jgi:hypothetical protein